MKKLSSLLFLCFAGSVANVHADKRPNILLFLVDDMGWQDTAVPFGIKKRPIIYFMRLLTWNGLP